jgi:tripartite-type tricarboxylate transporter receptor subunit TctC
MSDTQLAPPGTDSAYPTRGVRIIVPYASGGPTDAIARTVAQKLSERFGKPFYVENHAGASGNIGTGLALSAPPDGYTLLFATRDLGVRYDPKKNFVPVTLVAASPEVIVVHPSMPAKSMIDLIELLKAKPGKYNFASPGTFTSTHLAAERLFRLSNGLDLIHVPFNGAAPAIASTIEGYTSIAFTALPPATSHIREGKLRALAITSNRRSQALPDVATLAEAGFPDHESDMIVGMVAPSGTSKRIVDLLSRQTGLIAALPDVKQYLADRGFHSIVEEEFEARFKGDLAEWATVTRKMD